MQEQKTDWLRGSGWTLLVLEIIPIAVMLLLLGLNFVGRCTGALGSGVQCEKFNFSEILVAGEIFLLVYGAFVLLPSAIASVVVGPWGLWRRWRSQKEITVSVRSLWKEPYPYLLTIIAIFFFAQYVQIALYAIVSIFKF